MVKGILFSKFLLVFIILFSSINLRAMNRTEPKAIDIDFIFSKVEKLITQKGYKITKRIEFEILEQITEYFYDQNLILNEKTKLSKEIDEFIKNKIDYIFNDKK